MGFIVGFHSIVMTTLLPTPATGVYMIPAGTTLTIDEGMETIITEIMISGELIVNGRITII